MKQAFATDGSECSRLALQRALDIVSWEGREAILLTVAPQPVAVDYTGSMGPPNLDYEALAGELEASSRKLLDEAAALLGARGIAVREVLLSGDAGDAILDWERQEHPDLLILGSHGRTGFRRFLLGSVSSKVVAEAACPVLVIKAPEAGD